MSEPVAGEGLGQPQAEGPAQAWQMSLHCNVLDTVQCLPYVMFNACIAPNRTMCATPRPEPDCQDGSSTTPSPVTHPMRTAAATMPGTQQHRAQPQCPAHLTGKLPTGAEQVQVGQGQGGPLGHGFRACNAAAGPHAGPPRLTQLPLWWLSWRQPVPQQGGRVGVCLGAAHSSQPWMVQQAAQGLGRLLRLPCCCQPLHRHGLV